MLKLDEIYCEGMVFQRGKTNRIAGRADDGQIITVYFRGHKYQGRVENGRFCVEVEAGAAGGPFEMKVEAGQEMLVIEEVFAGDVFLLGGQSNMEFDLAQDDGARAVRPLDNVHLYTVNPVEYEKEGQKFPKFEPARWHKAVPAALEKFSAIGYYLAARLQSFAPLQNVPLGLVCCAKGGTSASCWMDEKDLKDDLDLEERFYLRYWQDIQEQSEEEEDRRRAEFFAVCENYQKKLAEYAAAHPELALHEVKDIIGHTPWPQPKGKKDFGRPCALYHLMLGEISDYTFRAVVYYQGEEDSNNADLYEKLLMHLIETWRREFHDPRLPFYIVQLPRYAERKNDRWWQIRKAQADTAAKMNGVHLIVSIDHGEQYNIHPTDKSILGGRIGQVIGQYEYGQPPVNFPKVISARKEGDGIVLEFSAPVTVLPNSQNFAPAEENSRLVQTGQTDFPLYYAWENYPEVFLFSPEGLPAAPFCIQQEFAADQNRNSSRHPD